MDLSWKAEIEVSLEMQAEESGWQRPIEKASLLSFIDLNNSLFYFNLFQHLFYPILFLLSKFYNGFLLFE